MSGPRVARCDVCGLRIEKVWDITRSDDPGRWKHLGTVAGTEADADHKPGLAAS